MTNHVMLDLETMGTTPGSAIVAIGAVRFDPETGTVGGDGREFYTAVDLASCLEAGLTVDGGTVLWWLEQEDAARRALFTAPTPLRVALEDFAGWCPEDCQMWGNGAAFDNVILAAAYKALDRRQPWAFWNDRCYRTMKALSSVASPKFAGTRHNALDDAKHQARHLIDILGGGK